MALCKLLAGLDQWSAVIETQLAFKDCSLLSSLLHLVCLTFSLPFGVILIALIVAPQEIPVVQILAMAQGHNRLGHNPCC